MASEGIPADALSTFKAFHQDFWCDQGIDRGWELDASIMPEVVVEPLQMLCFCAQIHLHTGLLTTTAVFMPMCKCMSGL